MTPFEVANSDAHKTQLMETGVVTIYVYNPGRVDQYVDAIRTMATDLGLGHDDLIMSLGYDQDITVEVTPTPNEGTNQ